MKLTDLQPRWIHPNIFIFLCPHCQTVYLSCKNKLMLVREQREVFEKEFGPDWNEKVIPTRPSHAWKVQYGLLWDKITVTPSLDASDSGHWHGHITSGQTSP